MDNYVFCENDTNELLPPSAFTVPETLNNVIDNAQAIMHTALYSPVDRDTFGGVDQHPEFKLSSEELLSRLNAAESRVLSLELLLKTTQNEKFEAQRLHIEAVTELQRMRSYIGSFEEFNNGQRESKDAPRDDRPCNNTSVEKLKTKISELEDRSTALQQQLDLSAVRIRSLEAVLRLQEKTLCQEFEKGSADESKCEELLRAWRTQTIRLLIQLEEYKVDTEHARARAARKEALVEKMRISAQTDQETLRLKLQASEAALTSEREQVKTLLAQLQQESSRYRCLEEKYETMQNKCLVSLTSLRSQSERLAQSVQTWFDPEPHSKIHTIDDSDFPRVFQRIRQLERRLNFAVNRLPLLRTHMTYRRTIVPETTSRSTQTGSIGRELDSDISYSELKELLIHAQNEAKHCRAERDSALIRLDQSSKSFHQRVQAAQDEVKTELCTLRESVRSLEVSLQERTQELSRCNSAFAELNTKYAELQQSAEADRIHLQAKVNETQNQLTKAKAELRRAKRCLDLEWDRQKAQSPGSGYEAQTQRSESILQLPISARSTHSRFGETAFNPNQTGPLVQSLKQLSQLVDCLRSSSSSDAEPENECAS